MVRGIIKVNYLNIFFQFKIIKVSPNLGQMHFRKCKTDKNEAMDKMYQAYVSHIK